MGNSRDLNIIAAGTQTETIWFEGLMLKAQERDRRLTLANAVMNLRVPLNEKNLLSSLEPVGFLRRALHHGVRDK